MTNEIIFFGNGPLADFAKAILAQHFTIIFHAKTKEDLETVKSLKTAHPAAHGVLASFGVLIKSDLLTLFEPEGIINIHPSKLPDFRGASPIESAILRGDTTFTVSLMKLVRAMDAGPLFHQIDLDFSAVLDPSIPCGTPNTPLASFPDAAAIKTHIYQNLAETAALWLIQNLQDLPVPTPQQGNPTFCAKFDKSMSYLHPETTTAAALHRQIIAHAIYPRSKIALGGHETLILASHVPKSGEKPILTITASDGQILALDRVQPAGKRPMDAQSFKNGYLKPPSPR